MSEFMTEPTETIHAISLDDFDRDTLRVVALAYRDRRRAGYADLPSFNSAMAVYRMLHPEVPDDRNAEIVAQMIAAAINADTEWFWRGVPVTIG